MSCASGVGKWFAGCCGLEGGDDDESVYGVLRKVMRMQRASRSSFSRGDLLLKYNPRRSFGKHYKKGAKLGQGGFGAVFRCQHRTSGDMRALKVIEKSAVQKDMEYVHTEIEAMLRLDHPNIVKLFEFFEQRYDILVVLELCTGGDFGKIHRDSWPMESIRPLFRDIVLGMAYCHDLQIVHRDLKFENCLVVEGERRKIGKIIDFGLSAIRRCSGVDGDGTPQQKSKSFDEGWLSEALGTKFFAAPEVIDKRVMYGAKCDVWSLGVMLYIMFANEHPFAKDATTLSSAELFKRVLQAPYREEPIHRARAPMCAVALLQQMLDKDAARRISALQSLDNPWLRPLTFKELDVSSAISQESSDKLTERLETWSGTSHFEKVILMLVAHQAKQREVEVMRAAFVAIDRDGNGSLSKQELTAGLKSMGHAMSKVRFEEMYKWLDSNDNDQLDYTEWLCATMEPSIIEAESSMRELFGFFDRDGNGYLSQQELLDVTDAEEAKEILERGDSSHDGRIDYEEFKALMKSIAKMRSGSR